MDREDDTDLNDLLGPTPTSARQFQALAKTERLGSGRLTNTRRNSKLSQERMLSVLNQISKMPVAGTAALASGIHPQTVQLWLAKSKLGLPGDQFDVVLNPDEEYEEDRVTKRFHEAYDIYLQLGLDVVESAMIQRAIGYEEVLTYQGRVIYKKDPELIELGLPDYMCTLKDAKGRPVPETIWKQDPDLMMFIMKARRANIYGNKQSLDLNVKGGVLVVGAKAITGATLNDEERSFRENAIDVEFEEVEDDRSGQ